MKSVRFIYVSFDKKDYQIISEKSDKIKVKEYLKSENNYFNEDLFFEINFFLLKKKYEVLLRKINIKKELVGLFLFLIAYLYYYSSLESCFKGEEICSSLFNWQLIKVYQELKSCFLTAFILELIFYKLISKFHFIHFLLAFLMFYKYRHGTDFEDHGYFNFIFFFIILSLIIIIIIPFNSLFYIIRKKKSLVYSFIYIWALITIIYYFYFYIYIKRINCDDWGKGLNKTFIINNKSIYGCQIQFPKKCSYKLFHFFQDFTKIIGKNCTKMIKRKARKILVDKAISPFLKNETLLFGYPLSNRDPDCIKEKSRNTLKNNFFNNLVDMNNKQILNKFFNNRIPEVLVNFTGSVQGKMEIDVHFDQNLSKSRKLLEKNSEPLSNNVLVIYIDSVSRKNSIRELKKTLEFFETFMPYKGQLNIKYPKEKYHSFQFFKYHAFKGYTAINYPLLFYGQHRKVKKKKLINLYFRNNGYITSLAHDLCSRDNSIRSNHQFILDEVFDHEFILCDPNQEDYNLNSIRCLYGKNYIEHLLTYAEQFWRKYEQNRKFSLIVSNDGHEGTLQVLKYVDNFISSFLWNLFNDNLLRNTTIFLVSDHGTGMPSLYYIYEFYKIEHNLPMLYIFVNDKKNSSYEQQYKYMHENQQNFITAFDFYNTLCHIIFGDKYNYIKNKTAKREYCKSPYGESLFNKINNNKDRHPKKYRKISRMDLNACK